MNESGHVFDASQRALDAFWLGPCFRPPRLQRSLLTYLDAGSFTSQLYTFNEYMSFFKPTRASPPPKAALVSAVALARDLIDDSRSSAVSTSELANLSPDEVEFIDTVIERASATATTFLSVFKAYNDVLHERGLDPQNEVLYYGKLLKIGTLKGANWGDKWRAVKQQHGYNGGRPTINAAAPHRVARLTRAPASTITTRLTTGVPARPPEDTFTLHSHQDDTDSVFTFQTVETTASMPQYHQTPRQVRRALSPIPIALTNSLGLDTGPPSTHMQFRTMPSAAIHPRRQPAVWDDEDSDATSLRGTAPTLSTTPPSYGAATREQAHIKSIPYVPFRFRSKEPSRAGSSSPPPQAIPASRGIVQTKERRNSVLNEEDAWARIREAQDEKEADKFREDKLIERCWDVWKQGYDWIVVSVYHYMHGA